MFVSREKKERVLHARIPESLDSEIKTRAEQLGISVSNLVRNVLQNTFDMVEDIVSDASSIAKSARGEPTVGYVAPALGAAPPPPPEILGWQALVVARNALCDRCNAVIAKGTPGHVAVLSAPGTPVFRCNACVIDEGELSQ